MTRVTRRGQIVIPVAIRRALKIEPGTRLTVSIQGNTIQLCVAEPVTALAIALLAREIVSQIGRNGVSLKKKTLVEVLSNQLDLSPRRLSRIMVAEAGVFALVGLVIRQSDVTQAKRGGRREKSQS